MSDIFKVHVSGGGVSGTKMASGRRGAWRGNGGPTGHCEDLGFSSERNGKQGSGQRNDTVRFTC